MDVRRSLNTEEYDEVKVGYEPELSALHTLETEVDHTVDVTAIQSKSILERISNVVIAALLFIKRLFSSLFRGRKGSQGTKEYFFTQQFNDSCHLSPWANLKILQELRSQNFDTEKMSFKTRRQWLGENQSMLIRWHSLTDKITAPGGKENYPHLHAFLTRGLEDSPMLPHFYDQNGKFPFSGVKGMMEFAAIPYFLIDVEGLQEVSVNVLGRNLDFSEMMSESHLYLKSSIVNDRGTLKIYNQKSGEYDPIETLSFLEVQEVGEIQQVTYVWDKVTDEVRSQYYVPPETDGLRVEMLDEKGLGFDQLGVIKGIGGGLELEGKSYTPYEMSLLKLMFLASGVDSDNNAIDEEHELYGVYNEFKSIMAGDPDNLWHPENLNKETIIQYQLANIFKENPEMFESAKKTVDILFSNWKVFENLKSGKYFDSQGDQIQFDKAKDFILGDEQALTYFMLQNVRYLWYSGINPNTFVDNLEMGLSHKLSRLAHWYIKRQAKKKIDIGNGERKSFLDVWKELLTVLKEKNPQRTDYISFDEHGWVVSTDPEVIALQNRESQKFHDRGLIADLGIAGIESWWGSQLNLWYSRVQAKGAAKVIDTEEGSATAVSGDDLPVHNQQLELIDNMV